MKKISLLLTGILYIAFSAPRCYSQASIAPIAIYMNDNDKTGRIVVRNSSELPIEVNIDMLFGYPATNQEGDLYLKKFDEIPADEPSANSWVRVYPRHTILPVGQQQTIRFAARPPAGLAGGEYWSRPTVSVRKIDNNAEGKGNQKYKTNINVIQRTILSLNYRHGNVKTGAKISSLETQHKAGADTLFVHSKMEREGNAAYLGDLYLSLIDASGNRKKFHQEEIAIYHSQSRKFAFDTGDVPPGEYKLELMLDTRERATQNKDILSSPAVRQSEIVRIK